MRNLVSRISWPLHLSGFSGKPIVCSLAFLIIVFASPFLYAQVGIGTQFPKQKLHVFEGSVFAESKQPDPVNNTVPPKDSVQYIFQWLHDKGALRSITERPGTGSLDPTSVGRLSFAAGYENFAVGEASVALGVSSFAVGVGSFAVGQESFASGSFAIALGNQATAAGDGSVAIGAMVSTGGKRNSFVFGSRGGQLLQNDATEQLVAGFSGGYKLYTDDNTVLGVQLAPGSNSWSVLSDVNKKENFAPVNGEEILKKIGGMKLTSWNYKGQDLKVNRHYGPMAQDFFKAFGKDEYGAIGTDTTINQADFDGVNFIAIQALVKRTEQLQQLNEHLHAEVAALKVIISRAKSTRMRKKAWVAKR